MASIEIEWNNTGTSTERYVGRLVGGAWVTPATTFTAGTVGVKTDLTITSVKLKLKKVATAHPGNTYGIYIAGVDANGLPTTVNGYRYYASADDVINDAALTTNYAVYEYSLVSGHSLIAGSTYAIIVYGEGGVWGTTGDYIAWDSAGAYSGGSTSNCSINPFDIPPFDNQFTAVGGNLYFEVWGKPIPPVPQGWIGLGTSTLPLVAISEAIRYGNDQTTRVCINGSILSADLTNGSMADKSNLFLQTPHGTYAWRKSGTWF